MGVGELIEKLEQRDLGSGWLELGNKLDRPIQHVQNLPPENRGLVSQRDVGESGAVRRPVEGDKGVADHGGFENIIFSGFLEFL